MSKLCLFSQLCWTEWSRHLSHNWSQKWNSIQIHIPLILISMVWLYSIGFGGLSVQERLGYIWRISMMQQISKWNNIVDHLMAETWGSCKIIVDALLTEYGGKDVKGNLMLSRSPFALRLQTLMPRATSVEVLLGQHLVYHGSLGKIVMKFGHEIHSIDLLSLCIRRCTGALLKFTLNITSTKLNSV